MCCLLFSRVSNNEKKLEAVRSGVRAISVSGKIEIMHSLTNQLVYEWYLPLLHCCLSVCLSIPSNICFFSLFVFLSVGTTAPSLSLSVSHPVLSVPAFIRSLPPLPHISPLYSHPFTLGFVFLFFLSHSLVLFPARLAADLVTSTPPKPTKARRFLLPFVFCSDSPPNGILGSRWTVSGGAFPQNCDVAEKLKYLI